VLFVECRAPADVLISRALARAKGVARVSDADAAIVRRQLRDAEPLDEVPADAHFMVRSDLPVGSVVDAIADAIDAAGRRP
jgi:predicted kinase